MYSDRDHLTVGFPHSDICGSKGARPSPQLFAACHVLHRLSVPRHPPDALKTLDLSMTSRRSGSSMRAQKSSPPTTARTLRWRPSRLSQATGFGADAVAVPTRRRPACAPLMKTIFSQANSFTGINLRSYVLFTMSNNDRQTAQTSPRGCVS